jgi:hypothetical protein
MRREIAADNREPIQPRSAARSSQRATRCGENHIYNDRRKTGRNGCPQAHRAAVVAIEFRRAVVERRIVEGVAVIPIRDTKVQPLRARWDDEFLSLSLAGKSIANKEHLTECRSERGEVFPQRAA